MIRLKDNAIRLKKSYNIIESAIMVKSLELFQVSLKGTNKLTIKHFFKRGKERGKRKK